MKETDRKIIDAVIAKAERECPDSLALIGVYGSAATGDVHEKSDLDLLILINDERGRRLADGFILDDTGIGYDLYCTDWEGLERDAQCRHAHLSKLMDSVIVYIKDPDALCRLEELRRKAAETLASDVRYEKAQAVLDDAKKAYAECFLSDSIGQVRMYAGATIHCLLDAMMLFHGKYFRKGVKRTFEEIGKLRLPFDMEGKVMAVIRSETAEDVRTALTELVQSVQALLTVGREKAEPGRKALAGTYEEMFSNWRNKMHEAVGRQDVFSSFMNMISFRFMQHEIAENVQISDREIMTYFDPAHLDKNAEVFDDALASYLTEYGKAGIRPRRFDSADSFAADYLKAD